ncbi:MAG: MATE family efflux transporter [Roseburia sp.]|nr:MATE family efflux transporter [Roseburia sp.]
MKNLTEGKPIKLILQFALPLFIGQLFQLFYSLVDTRIVGETLGESALAAVGSTTTLSDLLMSLLLGVLNGFSIVIATYFGAKNETNMKKAIASTILFGTGAAVIISGLSLCFLAQLLRFLNVSADLLPNATSYITVILSGLVIATLYNVCASILRAIGDSFTPLLFLILSTILNIFLDYTFILHFHMGVAGAAVATVISQAVSAILCFLYMWKKYPNLHLCKDDFRLDREVCRKMLSTGASMAFMSAFVQFGTFALQTSINTFGTNIIVAHTAARKATSIFMMPWSALGTTLATFCGQNLGAGKYSRIKTGLRDTTLITWGWSLLVILAANTIAPQMIQMITATNEPEIIETATLYLRVDSAFYFVPSVICLFRNAMQGFGDSKTPVFSSALELLTKVVIAFLLAPAIGYWAIIICEPIAWIIMVIPLVVNTLRSPVFKKTDITQAFSE